MSRFARGIRRLVPAALVAGAGLVSGAPAAGQEAGLERIDSLVAEGRVTLAREALQAWWDAASQPADRRDRQRALWLRGRLTVDPAQARRDYQRLVLEYPGGAYTARALLRLGRHAHAEGRLVEAAEHLERLVRDYPDSPRRLEARRWLDENGEAVARARRQAAREEVPEEPAGEVDAGDEAPVEPDARADSAGTSPMEGAGEAPDGAAGEEAEPAAAGPVAVQLGAFSGPERARALARRARELGLDVRLVRVEGSELIRLRAGRFPTREAARDLRRRIRGMDLESVIVTDADRERPIQ